MKARDSPNHIHVYYIYNIHYKFIYVVLGNHLNTREYVMTMAQLWDLPSVAICALCVCVLGGEYVIACKSFAVSPFLQPS